MLDKETAKEKIKAIIEHYHKQKESYDKVSEQDIRLKLIDKVFKALGWDLDGDENPDEVFREEGIRDKDSKKKKADYVFRLNGVPKFVVEAKAIKGVDMDNEEFRKQAIGYAYNLACSWAVLTNFIRTTVLFVDRNDDTPIRDIKDLSDLSNFDRNFESLWLLAKQSIKDELLEKDIELRGIKPQREKVGEQLFEDLKDWRKRLSDDIKKRYHDKFKDYEIEEIVQKIIDRLIFIRKLEDLELEERKLDQLVRKFTDKTPYYEELKKIFGYYHEKYNSGLFGDNGNLQQCDLIEVGTDSIREVILGMYKPKGAKIEYNFAAIDADILGNIYEQYLSYILKDTPKKAKLEGGRTHRKEQGIYYTPTYIVDYIVKNTINLYLKHKSLPEILTTRILDPACGSGSFLIKTFTEMCKLVEEKMKKGDRLKGSLVFNEYHGRLTIHQKITILTSCIYGVDLDKKAVEIAQLNLLLKLLEGETPETLSFSKAKKLLPMLNENIKKGNSLIDDSFASKDYFKWEEQYKSIIQYNDKGNLKEGYGFDVVIGNPPYINMQTLPELQKFCEKRYSEIYTGQNDIIYYFVIKAINLIKEQGKVGFIISRYFLESAYASKFRNFILNKTGINKIIDFNNFQVFGSDINTLTSIILLENKKPDKLSIIKIKKWDKDGSELVNLITKCEKQQGFSNEFLDNFYINQSELSEKSWTLSNKFTSDLKNKIEKNNKPLIEICDIGQGMTTGLNEAFVIESDRAIDEKIEPILLKNYIKTRDIKKYLCLNRGIKIIYLPKKAEENKINNALKHLENWKTQLKQRYDYKKGHCEWYSWGNLRNRELFESNAEKIITPLYSTTNKFIYDSGSENENYYTFTDTYIIVRKVAEKFDLRFILSLLNSKLIEFYFKNTAKLKRDGYYEYSGGSLSRIPIKVISENEQKHIVHFVDKIISLNKKLSELGDKQTDEVRNLKKQVEDVDYEINQEVYKLYGITKEEQNVIEESL